MGGPLIIIPLQVLSIATYAFRPQKALAARLRLNLVFARMHYNHNMTDTNEQSRLM